MAQSNLGCCGSKLDLGLFRENFIACTHTQHTTNAQLICVDVKGCTFFPLNHTGFLSSLCIPPCTYTEPVSTGTVLLRSPTTTTSARHRNLRRVQLGRPQVLCPQLRKRSTEICHQRRTCFLYTSSSNAASQRC